MPGQNVSWLEDRTLERSEHRSTDTLPASLRSNVFLTTTPNPYANHALASLAPHLGKGKDGPSIWKYGSLQQAELEKLEKLENAASGFLAFNDLLLEAVEAPAVGGQVQHLFFLGRPDGCGMGAHFDTDTRGAGAHTRCDTAGRDTPVDFLWVPLKKNGERGTEPTEVHRLWVGHGQTWLADRPALGHVVVRHSGQDGVWWHGVPPMPADGPDGKPHNWSLTRVVDLGTCSSVQLQALASAMDTAAAAAAPAAQACEPTRPLPMMPLDIQPAAYQIGCRIRARAAGFICLEHKRGLFDPVNAEAVAAGHGKGGATCQEQKKGIHDPANAEALAAGRKKTVRAMNEALGRAHGKPLGSCAGCGVEQVEAPAEVRWGANGLPVCRRHYIRWYQWKATGKDAKLADALAKAWALHPASDSDSDVEIVDSDSDVEIVDDK